MRLFLGGGAGYPAGLHCCYKGGRLTDGHIDAISPAVGGGGGKCKYGKCRTASHLFWDVWVIPFLDMRIYDRILAGPM